MENLTWALLIAAAYFIGSLPTAYLAARHLRKTDIRSQGDHNAGAANAYRVLGLRVGVAVGMIDIGKGALAVLLARLLADEQALVMAAGLAAVAGHNWPFYLRFRGGRGAATALGALMAFAPTVAVPLALGALATLVLSKRAMPALIIGFAPMPLVAWTTGAGVTTIWYVTFLPIVVGLSHFYSLRQGPMGPQEMGPDVVARAPEGH